MPSQFMRVTLRVPGWAKAGSVITASGGGQKFKVIIPGHLRPGQYFTVRVPKPGTQQESKGPLSAQSPEVSFNLEPNIMIGPDKFFKEVRSCGEWCYLQRICCPVVKFAGPDHDIHIWHNCCCLPCCFNFEIGGAKNGESIKTIGGLTPPGMCDQPLMALCCPCCYTGPLVQAKFVGKDGGTKYMMRREVKCCQYLCVCLNICNPCFRCFRFCCRDAQYTTYTQYIYGKDLDDKTQYAKLTYIKRMVLPCLPDETIQLKVEPMEGQKISKDDLVLLSMYPALVSGYTYSEFCLPLTLPGGMLMAMPVPTGIPQVDDANNIEGEHMNIKEALNRRKNRGGGGQVME